MKTIWKFPVEVTDGLLIQMPQGARLLTVQMQHGQPQLWAIVDPSQPKEMREFAIHGTGHQVRDDSDCLEYIGTFQIDGGSLVFHLFEVFRE